MLLPRKRQDSDFLQTFGGSQLPATGGEALDAAFEDPLLSTARLTSDIADRARADPRRTFVRRENPDGGLPILGPPTEEEIDLLQPDDVAAEFGVRVEEPTPRRVAEVIHEQQREEKIRQDILARGPKGVKQAVAELGVGFLAASLDPLNIASVFVPVVGEARAASIVARMGAVRGGAAVGAIEGTVGAALLEPFVFAGAQELDLDYSMNDALVNVLFGTVLGGGLHAATGGLQSFANRNTPTKLSDVGDTDLPVAAQIATGLVPEPSGTSRVLPTTTPSVVSQARPQARAEAARAAIIQLTRGETPTAPQKILELDRELDIDDVTPEFLEQVRQDSKRAYEVYKGVFDAETGQPFDEFVADLGGIRAPGAFNQQAYSAILDEEQIKLVSPTEGINASEIRKRAVEAGYFEAEPTFDEFVDALKSGKLPIRDTQVVQSRQRFEALGVHKDMDEFEFHQAYVQDALMNRPRTSPSVDQLSEVAAAKSESLTADINQPPASTKRFEQARAEAPKNESIDTLEIDEGLDQEVDFLIRNGDVSEEDARVLRELEEIAADEEHIYKAIDEAGLCLTGKA